MIVVNLLLNVVLIEILPVCGELIWIDLFAALNTLFCCVALAQSAFNIMLENNDSDHLLPKWLVRFGAGCAAVARTCFIRASATRSAGPITVGEHHGGFTEETGNAFLAAFVGDEKEDVSIITESVAGMLYRHQTGIKRKLRYTEVKQGPDTHPAASCATEHERRALQEKLVFFERLFFLLDEDCSLYIEADECTSLLAYCALDLDPHERALAVALYDSDNDGLLTRADVRRLRAKRGKPYFMYCAPTPPTHPTQPTHTHPIPSHLPLCPALSLPPCSLAPLPPPRPSIRNPMFPCWSSGQVGLVSASSLRCAWLCRCLARAQFTYMCLCELCGLPIAQIENSLKNMKDATDGRRRRAGAYWKRLAERLDQRARVIVPSLCARRGARERMRAATYQHWGVITSPFSPMGALTCLPSHPTLAAPSCVAATQTCLR